MKPIKRLPKITPRTSRKIKGTTNDQSRIRTDPEYLKKIQRVLDEVFPS